MRRSKTFNCERCGAPTTRMRHPWQPLICFDCGVSRAVATALALHDAAAAGWPEGGAYQREQFAAPMRARWAKWGVRGKR